MNQQSTSLLVRLLHRGCLIALIVGYAPSGWTFPWDKDMVDQPSVKAQESASPGDPGPGSVPITGGETVPAPTTEDGMFAAKEDAAALTNPVPVSDGSIQIGSNLYEINCRVCHGKTGVGDGPVGQKFATKAPVNLNEAYTQDQADGQLFFTLTRGRGLMPLYRDALSPEERWHVINYVKTQFGEQ